MKKTDKLFMYIGKAICYAVAIGGASVGLLVLILSVYNRVGIFSIIP